MPQGKGTYGSKVGRPPEKKKIKKAKKNTPGLAAKAKKKIETRGKKVDSALDRMLAGKSPQKKKK